MLNYIKLSNKIKRKSKSFVDKLSAGLNKIEYKFVFQMFHGLLSSQSVKLSEISRALEEDITLKKTIERLSNNLASFKKGEKLFSNYINQVTKLIDDKTIFCIDHTDIAKPKSKKLESLCKVRDGSTGKITIGYKVLEIAALTSEKKMPVSVYSKVFSTEENDYISENHITLEAFKSLTSNFGNQGIRALDRGFDTNRLYEYFIENDEKFIIRAKQNRDVIYNNKRINILKVTNKYKGKYSLILTSKDGEKVNAKISYIPIELPAFPNRKLTLVVVFGFGKLPMMLITNMTSSEKIISITITKVYLLRWRIEDYFKFKKQQFDFENIRVRKLDAIKNLNLLLTIVIGYLGLLTEKEDDTIMVYKIYKASKSIYENKAVFTYYKIAEGIKNILKKSSTGIADFISKSENAQSNQLSLFNCCKITGVWIWE